MVATAAPGTSGRGCSDSAARSCCAQRHALAVLWLAVLLLGLLLLQIRNFYGLYAVLVAGARRARRVVVGDEPVQSLAAYTGTWFLLLAAPRPVLELQHQRRRGPGAHLGRRHAGPADPLPGLLWVGFFALVTLGCLGLGAGSSSPPPAEVPSRRGGADASAGRGAKARSA